MNIHKISRLAVPEGLDEIYSNSFNLLEKAEAALNAKQWEEVIVHCKLFLETFQFSSGNIDRDSAQAKNYRFIASCFINDNHNSESIITLKSLCENMLDFCELFFYAPSRKGIKGISPDIKEEDALFIYKFCSGFFNQIAAKVSRLQPVVAE